VDKIQIRQFTLSSFLLIFVAFQSCMPVAVKKYPHHPPYTNQEIANILLALKTQDHAVHTFFSQGTITFQRNGSKFEASSLIVGTRSPFKVKIEITHFWGRPLFHIMIDGDEIHILSFPEKLYYVRHIENAETPKLLPVRLDTNHLWAMGRGFPFLSDFNHAESYVGNRIALLNEQNKVIQDIEFYTESDLPCKSVFTKQNLEVSFSNFEIHNTIPYARITQLFDQKTETVLELKIKQTVLNKAVEASIFDVEVPADFVW